MTKALFHLPRLANLIAAIACIIFALGIRDTPDRPLPSAKRTITTSPSEYRSALTVTVFALAQVEVAASSGGARAVGAASTASTTAVAAEPLGNATVHVFWNDHETFHWVGSARTNAQGRTRVPKLPRGTLWVLAEAEGKARSSTQLVMDVDAREVSLKLAPAHEVSLRVIDEQGAPIENATLLVNGNDPLPYGALTDKNGAATVGRLGPPPYRVKASARGYESAVLSGVAQATTLRLRKLATLLVRVEDTSGKPVPEAKITISGTTLSPSRMVTTNADGLATIRGLLAGSFDLRAEKGNLVSPSELGLALSRGEEKKHTLRLAPGRMIAVWVTDGDGDDAASVGNADVVVAESGLSAFPVRGRTEPNGKVTLGPFEPGPLSASATARNFVGTVLVPVPAQQTGPVRIALRRGGTVRGRVVDVYGHPISGASIEIIGTDWLGLPVAETPRMRELQAAGFARALTGPAELLPIGELGVTKGPVPSIPGATASRGEYVVSPAERRVPIDLKAALSEVDNWVTRYDGGFVAHPVTPGRLRALVRHPAYVEGLSDTFSLTASATVEVTVTLRGGGSLEGIVVDQYGRPLGGARVSLASTRGGRVQSTDTADDGAFAFSALPEEVIVSVARPENPERTVVRERVSVREGKRETLRIVLPQARESVECRVVDERGDAIEGAEVVLASLEVDAPLRQTRFTSREGFAVFEDARGLELSMTVDSVGYAPTTTRYKNTPERVTLTLSRGVRVSGRVTSVRGRVPVAMARVTIVSQGRRRVATTNRDGEWQLADVPEGAAHFVVEGPNLPAVEFERRIERQARVERPFELGEVDLPDAVTVTGRVVDAGGEAVAGARVSAHVEAATATYQASDVSTTSDSAGNFRLTPVSVGKVTLHAVLAGVGQGQSDTFELYRDRDRDGLTIKLNQAAATDESSSALAASVAVSLALANGRVIISRVHEASEAERAGIRAGDVVLSIDGGSVSDLATALARLSGPENMDVLIELERQGKTMKLRTVREAKRR